MPLIWLAFFASGIAGLSYELVWVRSCTHLLGASLPAISTTVAVYFIGLAAGSGLSGRWFDRRARPARAYALLELLIGGAAVAVPALFHLAERLLAHRATAEGTPLLVLSAAAVLLVPAALIGATFPAMVAVARRLPSSARSVGLLYGLNTLGGVAGCLLTSFSLLPALGESGATRAIALVNLLTAALLILARDGELLPKVAQSSQPTPAPARRLPARLAYLIAAGTGFLGIAIEILWTRVVALSFLPAVQVLAPTLAAYLVGIAGGSLLVAALHRGGRAARRRSLFLLLLASAAGCWLTLVLLPRVGPLVVGLLQDGAIRTWTGYLLYLSLFLFLAELPATLAMGAVLPLLIGLAVGDGAAATGKRSRLAGRLYAANTVAGVAGSLIGTFWLMPALGTTASLAVLASAYVALALAAAGALARPLRPRVAAAILLLGSLTAITVAPEVNRFRGLVGRPLYLRDEPSGTVEVSEDEARVRHLRFNNFHGLSDTERNTVEMQYLLGHVPLLLHPEPRRALLIGFGTGATLAAMAEHPLRELHVVELHRSLLSYARFFRGVNREIWADPRVRIIADDGRRYLARRRGVSYDLIVGDLYLPQDPGVGSLYSVEHFSAARARLAPGGVFVAWLPLFQLGPGELGSVVRAFLVAFPGGEGWVGHWSPGSPILGLVGAADRGGADVQARARVAARLPALIGRSLRVAFPELDAAQVAPHPPFARRLLTAGQLEQLAAGAAANTLERAVVEFRAPRSLFEERLSGHRLAARNLARLGALVSLEGTPWGIR